MTDADRQRREQQVTQLVDNIQREARLARLFMREGSYELAAERADRIIRDAHSIKEVAYEAAQ